MSHEYIVHYEAWKDGAKSGCGSLSVTVDSISTPDASLFHKNMCEKAASICKTDSTNIVIIGVFKL